MKTCTNCGVAKPLDEFHRDKTQRDGHAYRCGDCKRQATLAWNARRRAEMGEVAWLARGRKVRAECLGRAAARRKVSERVMLNARVSEDTVAELTAEAERRGVTRSDAIREALDLWLDRERCRYEGEPFETP